MRKLLSNSARGKEGRERTRCTNFVLHFCFCLSVNQMNLMSFFSQYFTTVFFLSFLKSSKLPGNGIAEREKENRKERALVLR